MRIVRWHTAVAVVLVAGSIISGPSSTAMALEHHHRHDHHASDSLDTIAAHIQAAIDAERKAITEKSEQAADRDLARSAQELGEASAGVKSTTLWPWTEDVRQATVSQLDEALRQDNFAESSFLFGQPATAIGEVKTAIAAKEIAKADVLEGGVSQGNEPGTPRCEVTPATAQLNLLGAFSATVDCAGLPPLIPIDAGSPALAAACPGGFDINGGPSPATINVGNDGKTTFSIAGLNCVPGDDPITISRPAPQIVSLVIFVELRAGF